MPNFIGSAIAWGQYFYLYQRFKELMRGSRTSRRELGPGQHLAAGFSAGAVTATCTNPIWVVKTRMQTQMRGTQGNYRGLLRTCARNVPALLTCAAHRTRPHAHTHTTTTQRHNQTGSWCCGERKAYRGSIEAGYCEPSIRLAVGCRRARAR